MASFAKKDAITMLITLMLQFQKITDFNGLKKYFELSPISFCDISAGAKYMWRNVYVCEYAFYDDTLIIKESSEEYKDVFYYPMGKNPAGAVKAIEEYCVATNTPLTFGCIDNVYAAKLAHEYGDVEIISERDWNDYIYEAQSFKTYAGKKYGGQRNHVNKFRKTHPDYTFNVLKEEDLPEIKRFLSEYENGADISSHSAAEEEDNVYDATEKSFVLGQVAGYIRTGGKIVAFSLGEVVGDTLIVHIEKALRAYAGAYPTVASEFAKAFAGAGVKYINREEDCGDMGLRVSKMQYHPTEIKQKNTVYVHTSADKLKLPLKIATERLVIEETAAADDEDYYRLYSDDKLNEFWGYDYREDLGEKKADKKYFAEFRQGLREKKEEYSFMVKKDGKVVGEIVLYGFGYRGEAEIGFRFYESEQGKGYATESVGAFADYMLTTCGYKKIKAKAFIQNEKSLKLIRKLGFKKTGEDEKFFYFEKMPA